MLKKSLLVATLLVSNAYGAEVSTFETSGSNPMLSKIYQQIEANNPLLHTFPDEEKKGAISNLQRVLDVLKANCEIIALDPGVVIDLINCFQYLRAVHATTDVLKFALEIDNNVLGQLKPHLCFFLYREGERKLALESIQSLISNQTLNVEIRKDAVDSFYAMDKTKHSKLAREMLADLCVSVEGFSLEEAHKLVQRFYAPKPQKKISPLKKQKMIIRNNNRTAF